MGIEALSELAVQFVSKHQDLSRTQRRSYYASIYALQGGYDCSYTHMRCAQILIRDGFLHHIGLEDHPAFAEQKDALLALLAQGRSWLPLDPSAPKGDLAGLYFEKAPIEGTKPGLYFDVSDPLFEIAQKAKLVSVEGEPFQEWEDGQALLKIMNLAARSMERFPSTEARELLKGYYGFSALHLSWAGKVPNAEDPTLRALFESPILKEVLLSPSSEMVDERFPIPSLVPGRDELFSPEAMALFSTPLKS